MERVVIDRWECAFLRSYRGGWLLVYGRRKTGKTWLLRRCLDWRLYAVVGRDGRCLLVARGGGYGVVGLDECVDRVVAALGEEGVVVLDEFQRLPERYWDLLAHVHESSRGLLVACGSSLGVARRVFDRRSPLLGLLSPMMIGLASLHDTVVSLASHGLSPREAILWSIVVRDPWVLAHVEPRGEPWRVLAAAAPRLAPAARGLIGEVFEEEERQLTRLYDAILQLLASRVWRAAEIAQRLYEMGLSSSPSPGSATGPLRVLEEMGLVQRLPLWRTRGARVYYRHRSSTLAILYSVQDVVDLGETPRPETIQSMYGLELQFNLGEMLAEAKGLQQAYSIPATGADIDILLLDRRGRPTWGYEVKLGEIDPGEARRAVARIREAGVPWAGLISLHSTPPGIGDEALGPVELLEVAKRLYDESRRRARELALADLS